MHTHTLHTVCAHIHTDKAKPVGVLMVWDVCVLCRHPESVWANPPGGGTSAPQKDWPCLIDDGMDTCSPN